MSKTIRLVCNMIQLCKFFWNVNSYSLPFEKVGYILNPHRLFPVRSFFRRLVLYFTTIFSANITMSIYSTDEIFTFVSFFLFFFQAAGIMHLILKNLFLLLTPYYHVYCFAASSFFCSAFLLLKNCTIFFVEVPLYSYYVFCSALQTGWWVMCAGLRNAMMSIFNILSFIVNRHNHVLRHKCFIVTYHVFKCDVCRLPL